MMLILGAIITTLLSSSVDSFKLNSDLRSSSAIRHSCSALYSSAVVASSSSGTTKFDESNRVINGDSRLPATYAKAKLGKAPLELADILVTDPPYCLLNRRRTGGDLRDPKVRKKKLDDSDTVTRFENLKEYKVFTKEWLKPCIEYGLKQDAGDYCVKQNDILITSNLIFFSK